MMSLRRWFILALLIWASFAEAEAKDIPPKEAMFYQKLDPSLDPSLKRNKKVYPLGLEDGSVQCGICFRKCIIPEGGRGFCRNRENRKGLLYNLVYGRPSAVHIDPVEKEPQLHFLPGSSILCLGTAGCNFRCQHCHNWHLSQRSIEQMEYIHNLTPPDVVDLALRKNIPTISFTYNEPISFYEYVYDVAKLAKQKGLRIIWHSNGSINPEPLSELLKYTDAVTIDLKGFTSKFYSEVSQARLEPVLQTLKAIKQAGVHLEIVNLVIPTLNDNPVDLRKMCVWIKENLGPDVPLHFSRFSPAYKITALPPTPINKLEEAYSIAKEVGLNYVTIGNVPGHIYNSTFCRNCKKRLIQRRHFTVLENNIEEGRCKFCKTEIPGIWE